MPEVSRGGVLTRILRKVGRVPAKTVSLLDRISRLPGIGNVIGSYYGENRQETKCQFLLSTGRVGTVTLIHLLNASEGTKACHEPKPMMLHERRSSYAECQDKPERYRCLFDWARRRLIGSVHRCGKLYAEATPMQFFTPVIADTFVGPSRRRNRKGDLRLDRRPMCMTWVRWSPAISRP